VARDIYGADGIDLSPSVAKQLRRFEVLGYGECPVVIAKTHPSLSSDPTLMGASTGWRMPVREIRAAVGAGYVYAIGGEMRTIPGLPKHPVAERIDIDQDGNIVASHESPDFSATWSLEPHDVRKTTSTPPMAWLTGNRTGSPKSTNAGRLTDAVRSGSRHSSKPRTRKPICVRLCSTGW
jgi:hypothetical protein